MSIKIEKNKIDDILSFERYVRKTEDEKKQENIQHLLELVRNNPDITEEMISPELRKYLGVVKREYKKEIIANEHKRSIR